MQKVIIADSSCLILLEKIGELALLHRVFGEIAVTKEVANEFGEILPDWFNVVEVKNQSFQKMLEASLGVGESSAIAYAVDIAGCLLIIEDLKGRRMAEKLGITITGTLGVMVEARLSGVIGSVIPLLEKIRETDFRLTRELEENILNKAGEAR